MDNESKCPKFDQFLYSLSRSSDRVLEEQRKVRILQEAEKTRLNNLRMMVNAIFKGDSSKFYILTGDGRNGKSTLMYAIAGILGHENVIHHSITEDASEMELIEPINVKFFSNLGISSQTTLNNFKLLLDDGPAVNVFRSDVLAYLESIVDGGLLKPVIVICSNHVPEFKSWKWWMSWKLMNRGEILHKKIVLRNVVHIHLDNHFQGRVNSTLIKEILSESSEIIQKYKS